MEQKIETEKNDSRMNLKSRRLMDTLIFFLFCPLDHSWSTVGPFTLAWNKRDIRKIATFWCKLPSCSLETSPEKYQAGVRFFWNLAMFRAKLASVNANRRNFAIFHHVTFGTSGLLRALFEIVYDPQHYTTTCTRTHTHTHTHTHIHTQTHTRS